MIVGVPDHAGQDPPTEPSVVTGLQQVMCHQQFIHGRRRLHKIDGYVRVKDRLGAVACFEMTCMSQFMGKGEHIRHALIPGEKNI